MHSDAIRRILQTALNGTLFFCVIAEGFRAVWPWFFALPHVAFWYLWPLLGYDPSQLFWFGLAGLIFGALVGIPRHWWWSMVICAGIDLLIFVSFAVYTVVTSIGYYSLTDIFHILINQWTGVGVVLVLITCVLFGLLIRAATQLPNRIKSASKTTKILAKVAIVGVLVFAGLLFTRLLSDPANSVEILAVYETAQEKGWQIQSMKFEGLVADSGYGVLIHLEDGSTHACIYWVATGDEYAYGDLNGVRNTINVQDAISCPP